MTCGCVENHWQELAAFVFMGVGIAVPIFYVMKRIFKPNRINWIKRLDKIVNKKQEEDINGY